MYKTQTSCTVQTFFFKYIKREIFKYKTLLTISSALLTSHVKISIKIEKKETTSSNDWLQSVDDSIADFSGYWWRLFSLLLTWWQKTFKMTIPNILLTIVTLSCASFLIIFRKLQNSLLRCIYVYIMNEKHYGTRSEDITNKLCIRPAWIIPRKNHRFCWIVATGIFLHFS